MNCTISCECKIARHEHGTRNMYIIHKCRGTACREAARLYENKRRRQRAYGIEVDRVDAQPVREHVEFLRLNGVSYKALAQASGVARSAIIAMIHGRPERGHAPYARVQKSTSERILAVKPAMDNMAAGRPIDATGTIRRLQALVAIGHSIASLGDRMGIGSGNMHSTMHRGMVTVKTARKVRDLYEELWDKPNNSTEWQLLGAVTRARNYAIFHGWLPPMAWDDDLIDNPDYSLVSAGGSSKVDAKREAFLEEAEFFASAGETLESLASSLGVSAEAVEKRLERFECPDLLQRLRFASKSQAAA